MMDHREEAINNAAEYVAAKERAKEHGRCMRRESVIGAFMLLCGAIGGIAGMLIIT